MSEVHDGNRKQKTHFLVEITEMRNQQGRCFYVLELIYSLKVCTST